MALHLLSTEELRASCRQRLESCELWLRRLIHETLLSEFGSAYINTATLNGQPLFGGKVRKRVASRLATAGHGYARPIDTLLLDDLKSVLCKQDAFGKYFQPALRHGFPCGSMHLRLVLDRLVPIRNALSHANPISAHDAERVLCYCSDIISSLVVHYEGIGMSRDFDAPSFTRYGDSVGRVRFPSATDEQLNFTQEAAFRAGDTIWLEVDVDAYYPSDGYTVKWQVANIHDAERGEGQRFVLTLLPKHVSKDFAIFVSVASNKAWHRHGSHDARLVLVYTVLPPI